MEKKLRLVQIGLGHRGAGLLRNILANMEDVEFVGVCDAYADRTKDAADAVEEKTGKRPIETQDYRVLMNKDLADAVLVSSAWEQHIDITCAAMEAGIPVGCEVGGAYTLEDCWRLVHTYERTGTPCMMLENCCYGKRELMVKNMVEQGIFGEIVHCDGGYCHDLRKEISYGVENRHYRLRNYLHRNCDNYPTHALVPLGKILKINDGNRFTSLVSVASCAKGLHEYVIKEKGADNPLASAQFCQGDVVTTVIRCANGQTVRITLDTTLPRAYSRQFTVRGTKGAYFEDMDAIYIDGQTDNAEFDAKKIWDNAKDYEKDYQHPLWRDYQKTDDHGGIDYLVLRAFFESVMLGVEPPIDVYDMATYMSISVLSEQSIVNGSVNVAVPDFTNGKWTFRKEYPEFKYALR